MVGDDEFHLTMRQNGCLWPAGGAGGVEKPGGIIAIHIHAVLHRAGALGCQRFPIRLTGRTAASDADM